MNTETTKYTTTIAQYFYNFGSDFSIGICSCGLAEKQTLNRLKITFVLKGSFVFFYRYGLALSFNHVCSLNNW